MKGFSRIWFAVLFSLGASVQAGSAALAKSNTRHMVGDADIHILSTNLANGNTRGEWGLSALVRTEGRCILFDAGRFPDTVLHNAKELGADLSCVDTIVLSHFHSDHTGGLSVLMAAIKAGNADKRVKAYVAEGFFRPRYFDKSTPMGAKMDEVMGPQWNQMIAEKAKLESEGIDFVTVDTATEIAPGVFVTGPVERRFEESNFPEISVLRDEHGGESIDHVPDSQGLVIRTKDGPIVLLGCGHSGAVNLVTQVREQIQDAPVLALMGGLHLFNASDETLAWTGEQLSALGVRYLMAGHCTGVHPMYVLRDALGLDRQTAVIGAVGARFELGHGIHPTPIAQ